MYAISSAIRNGSHRPEHAVKSLLRLIKRNNYLDCNGTEHNQHKRVDTYSKVLVIFDKFLVFSQRGSVTQCLSFPFLLSCFVFFLLHSFLFFPLHLYPSVSAASSVLISLQNIYFQECPGILAARCASPYIRCKAIAHILSGSTSHISFSISCASDELQSTKNVKKINFIKKGLAFFKILYYNVQCSTEHYKMRF